MDGPSLEDVDPNVERWREKIEVKLDNRQVFFLFFGSAVVACMLFVLGVMVGKRIESRGQADAPVLQDPLAALDRAHQPPPGVAAPDPQLTFPSSLGLGGTPKMKASAHTLSSLPKVLPKAQPAPKVTTAPKPIALAKPVSPAPKPIAAAPKPIAAAKPTPAVAPPADVAKAKGKYTLQLTTFTTSADADAFVQKYPGAFVIAADVPGKGKVYRVRLGNYGSYKDAVAAKDSFEKQHSMIALIAAR
jgi:septal ring-binding cell division protein DamX